MHVIVPVKVERWVSGQTELGVVDLAEVVLEVGEDGSEPGDREGVVIGQAADREDVVLGRAVPPVSTGHLDAQLYGSMLLDQSRY